MLQDSIPVLELQYWIENARPRLTGQAALWLNDERLAAVTAVLRTNTLSIVAQQDRGGSIEFTVPEIQGIASVGAGVRVESGSGTRLTFTGHDPLVFGVQAYVMNFEGGLPFGLEEVRGGGDDYTEMAWTSGAELPAIEDEELPRGDR